MIKPIHRTIRGLVNTVTGTSKLDEKKRRDIFRTMKARANSRRSIYERLADKLTATFGSIAFLVLNVLFFAGWIYFNDSPRFAHLAIDPFPFNFLTMAVSLEAIILSIFVLMSQNRASRIDDIREELHLQINMISEKEITKSLQILAKLAEKNGINLSKDKDLEHYLTPLEESKLESIVEKEID